MTRPLFKAEKTMTKFALYVPLQAALMEKVKAGDLFAKAPEIHKLGILADKLPK
jgi:hypothetical protein